MSRSVISTGLPEVAPVAWTTRAGGQLWPAHAPIRDGGTFETGDIDAQGRSTFGDLRRAAEAAGAGLADVVQVVGHLADAPCRRHR